MSVQTLPIQTRANSHELDPNRPFVVVDQASGLINSDPGESARWVEPAIVRLYDIIEGGFYQTVAVDVAIALPVSFDRLRAALYAEYWINRAGRLIIHGEHQPCGDLREAIILPNGHEANWLPTIEVISMNYTDSLPVHDYRQACQIGFENLRKGRRHIEPFVLG